MNLIKGRPNDKESLAKNLNEYTHFISEIENNKYFTLYEIKQVMTEQEWQRIISASENMQKKW